MASAKEYVRTILRICGPLSLGEIVDEAVNKNYVTSGNPKQTITNALSSDALIQRTSEGQYAYLPTFIQNTRMRVPMSGANPRDGVLKAPGELLVLLWPFLEYINKDATATLHTPAGEMQVTFVYDHRSGSGIRNHTAAYLDLPKTFWVWWETEAAKGADALMVRCLDGEAGAYLVEATRTTDIRAEDQAAIDDEVRTIAESIVRRAHEGIWFTLLVRRLLTHGVYHRQPPSPVLDVLFDPPGFFVSEHSMTIVFRPEMTPAIRQLFAHRFADDDLDFVYNPDLDAEPFDDEEVNLPIPIKQPPSALYRFKVTLGWTKRVWRVIELLDNQTLRDFHNIIQTAFNWDDDHLYAFYMSNRRNDWLTSIKCRTGFENDPPHADEVILKMLGLKVGQHFQYLFDFGDQLDHDIELMHIGELPTEGRFPRIVLSRGEAPAQYPSFEDEDDETNDD